MIKIIALSDTHGKHKEVSVPDGDILVFAGDANMETISKTKDFLKWFTSFPHTFKVIVAGNHDYIPYKASETFKMLCEEHNIKYLKDTIENEQLSGAFYLEDAGFTAQFLNRPFKIYGSPWTREFMGWHFMKSGVECRKHWENIPIDTDILVTHSPPRHILDVNTEGKNLGCTYLLQKVNFEMSLGHPLYHFFGHIHPPTASQRRRHENDKFRNVSVLNENYELLYPTTTIYYEMEK